MPLIPKNNLPKYRSFEGLRVFFARTFFEIFVHCIIGEHTNDGTLIHVRFQCCAVLCNRKNLIDKREVFRKRRKFLDRIKYSQDQETCFCRSCSCNLSFGPALCNYSLKWWTLHDLWSISRRLSWQFLHYLRLTRVLLPDLFDLQIPIFGAIVGSYCIWCYQEQCIAETVSVLQSKKNCHSYWFVKWKNEVITQWYMMVRPDGRGYDPSVEWQNVLYAVNSVVVVVSGTWTTDLSSLSWYDSLVSLCYGWPS